MVLSIKRNCSDIDINFDHCKKRCSSTVSFSTVYKTCQDKFNNNDIDITKNSSSTSDSNNNNYITTTTTNNNSKIFRRSNSFTVKKNVIPNTLLKHDLIARERCFDYIVQCIDEVWGRYCNATSTAENLVYNNDPLQIKANNLSPNNNIMNNNNNNENNYNIDDTETNSSATVNIIPSLSSHNHNFKPLNISDLDDDFSTDDELSGYKSEATNLTEYETDSGNDLRTISKLPDSMKLQSLKLRLVKAKNDLDQFYLSENLNDCISFWIRWDMIKYNAVEMMEEDDDDEVIESIIEELEMGRYYRD
ncbi:hypothetical protein Kpol_2002p14 [Vanderwaltozyma polyspora DSM 70294]|uniref:Uncharacterized protein n=1 Tax=Vanderwaltozyma polyspora (strain ATCC 22028 / DSM 70294 / BCRC 21397 / CBS 2163 / NBRC 10782 / NRRL Y-8283 / UCD 57-17) TaxID=436907 RepID=A7TFD0_VANPO|nr:uncharacterized protein Kpol_2002p14 [Vanderwaltozyma polyspora DSM 70294]EDO18944.1 hypothetical protein Kpol_2002p14 [Vanderwaltozyma polyspora DSM 70294]